MRAETTQMEEKAKESEAKESRGQNALQRRAQQLKRWHEWTREADKERAPDAARVHFSAQTLFLSAVAQNDVQECERLLRCNRALDVNATTGDGLTALHQMAIDDNLVMCSWLLDNGADVNCRDNEGWTPLHASASCGHSAVVNALLSREDVDVFAINCDGELARDVCDGDTCLEAIEERMLKDMKTTSVTTTATTADDTTDDTSALIPESLLRELRAKELKQIETDFSQFLAENSFPTEEEIRQYVERTRDKTSGATVLHVCAAKGYNDCLQRILETISSFDSIIDSFVDFDGFTALHASAFWQQNTALEVLLKFGANFELKTTDAREVMDLCHENPKVAELLSETRKSRSEKPLKGSETQRKVNAKRQRETRRPTQGVSKEDIEMALKTTPNGLSSRLSSRVVSLFSFTALNDDSPHMTPPLTPPPAVPSSPPTSPPVTENGGPPAVHARRRPKRRSTGIEDNLELNDFLVAPSRADSDSSDTFRYVFFWFVEEIVSQSSDVVSDDKPFDTPVVVVVVVVAIVDSVAVRVVVAVAVHYDCAVVSDVGGDTSTTTASQSTHSTAVASEPTAGVVLAVESVVTFSKTTPTTTAATYATTPQTRSRSSSRGSLPTTDDSECEATRPSVTTAVDDKDYKKLYKELLKENEFLVKKLKDFEANRRQEKDFQEFQREKRQLLRRLSELEEELRTKEELIKENSRLKDENSALIRVISKLSK
ncbi:unnamed protein product [Medioppia subpectinata]|uniref:cGMP-dependent protein kinase interacting domain-containing protein n=1 Tax=Medioppia subpectinata TaxID=1979941 RepID=A0A7R9KUJ6_9ACAR|nr:unnamed protein product [Medioppia subpectinata]CAG2108974.1 unnamed protein product [Medioppia subpectinata]